MLDAITTIAFIIINIFLRNHIHMCKMYAKHIKLLAGGLNKWGMWPVSWEFDMLDGQWLTYWHVNMHIIIFCFLYVTSLNPQVGTLQICRFCYKAKGHVGLVGLCLGTKKKWVQVHIHFTCDPLYFLGVVKSSWLSFLEIFVFKSHEFIFPESHMMCFCQ